MPGEVSQDQRLPPHPPQNPLWSRGVIPKEGLLPYFQAESGLFARERQSIRGIAPQLFLRTEDRLQKGILKTSGDLGGHQERQLAAAPGAGETQSSLRVHGTRGRAKKSTTAITVDPGEQEEHAHMRGCTQSGLSEQDAGQPQSIPQATHTEQSTQGGSLTARGA